MHFTIILLLLFTSCSTLEPQPDPQYFYKLDMKLDVNGFKGEGVLIAGEAKQYKFDIKAKGSLDLFTFTTCHREQTKEKAGESGWFKSDKRRRFTYKPMPYIETGSFSCPVHLGGYEKGKGRHSWGLVDFQVKSKTLEAFLKCNGVYQKAIGVSICQARKGLIQEIKFLEPVLATEKGCTKFRELKGNVFRYKMPRGECVFRFVTKNKKQKWHRLTTVGYEKILIRKN